MTKFGTKGNRDRAGEGLGRVGDSVFFNKISWKSAAPPQFVDDGKIFFDNLPVLRADALNNGADGRLAVDIEQIEYRNAKKIMGLTDQKFKQPILFLEYNWLSGGFVDFRVGKDLHVALHHVC